jgi:hypothetical protein
MKISKERTEALYCEIIAAEPQIVGLKRAVLKTILRLMRKHGIAYGGHAYYAAESGASRSTVKATVALLVGVGMKRLPQPELNGAGESGHAILWFPRLEDHTEDEARSLYRQIKAGEGLPDVPWFRPERQSKGQTEGQTKGQLVVPCKEEPLPTPMTPENVEGGGGEREAVEALLNELRRRMGWEGRPIAHLPQELLDLAEMREIAREESDDPNGLIVDVVDEVMKPWSPDHPRKQLSYFKPALLRKVGALRKARRRFEQPALPLPAVAEGGSDGKAFVATDRVRARARERPSRDAAIVAGVAEAFAKRYGAQFEDGAAGRREQRTAIDHDSSGGSCADSGTAERDSE